MTGPRRIARAHYWTRGQALPDPGSFHEELSVELYERERSREFAFMYVMAQLFAKAFELPSAFVAELLERYEAELHQETYTPSAIAELRVKIRAEQAKKAEEASRAARVAAM